ALYRVGVKGGKVTTLANFTAVPFDVKTSADGKMAYVSLPGNNSVEAFDFTTGILASIGTGSNPQKMVLNAAGTRLFVATSTDVTTIDTATNTVLPAESISLAPYGGNGYAIAISGGFLAAGTQFNVVLCDVIGSFGR